MVSVGEASSGGSREIASMEEEGSVKPKAWLKGRKSKKRGDEGLRSLPCQSVQKASTGHVAGTGRRKSGGTTNADRVSANEGGEQSRTSRVMATIATCM